MVAIRAEFVSALCLNIRNKNLPELGSARSLEPSAARTGIPGESRTMGVTRQGAGDHLKKAMDNTYLRPGGRTRVLE